MGRRVARKREMLIIGSLGVGHAGTLFSVRVTFLLMQNNYKIKSY